MSNLRLTSSWKPLPSIIRFRDAMSFWFSRRERDGRLHVYSVNAPLHIVVPIVAILVVTFIGLIRGCSP